MTAVDVGTSPRERRPPPGSEIRGRLATHLRIPLHKAGYSLIGNAIATSALGLVFWAVAARGATEAAVGATGALLATMRLISHVADLGLRTGLVRFLPALRTRARRIVLGTYAVTGTVAALAATVFVLLHGRWFDDLTLLDRPSGAALFIGSSAIWVVFVLQDSVLVGLRRSTWVPVENAVYGVAKLAILVLAIGAFPQWGIYIAWVAPLPLLVAGIGVVVVGREIPRLAAQPAVEHAGVADLARYSAGDYGGSLLWHGTLELMPLLVLGIAGVTEAAYYTLAATIAMSLYLIPSAVGYAFVAEAAHDPASASLNLRRAARQSISLVIPAALLVVLGAPLVLGLLGASYSDEATTLLRLMALSSVPQVVTALAVNWHRARRQVAAIVRLYLCVFVTVLGLGVVLIDRFGATGAGVAWLTAQLLIASVLLATTLRKMWIGALPTHLLRAAAAPAHRIADARRARRIRRDLGPALRGVAADHGCAEVDLRVVQSGTDEAVVKALAAENAVIIKATWSGAAEAGRRREHHALGRLHADPRLREWNKLVPRPSVMRSNGTATMFAEQHIAGEPGDTLVGQGRGPAMARSGLHAIGTLHQATAELAVVDERQLNAWVAGPAGQIRAQLPHLTDGIDAIADEIGRALIGRVVAVASGHGDLHPGNVIFAPGTDEVVGLIDWVEAGDGRLPEVDLLTLAVATRAAVQRDEFGAALGEAAAHPEDPELLDLLGRSPLASVNGDLPLRPLLLLTWLTHVAANLTISDSYAASEVWVIRNVEQVLATVTSTRQSDAGPAELPERTVAASTPAATAILPRPADVDRGSPRPTTNHPAPAEVDEIDAPASRPLGATETGRRWWPDVLLAATATLGPLLWWLGFRTVDPRAIASIGPVADLPPIAFVGLALVIVGFAAALCAERIREGWLAAHTAGLVLMLSAVPPLVYGTTRYEWAWKHIGVIDYIGRFGTVDPTIEVADVYHNWPGFFAAAEALGEVTGIDPITLSRWAPAFFTAAITVAAFHLLSALVEDRRVAWLGTWLMVAINWIGQEYFSPQATAMVLYLVALGFALRLGDSRRGNTASLVIGVVALGVAIASSHQLTPVMLTVSLAGLALLGRRGSGSLAVITGTLTFGWGVWVAFAFVGPELRDEIGALGAIFGNAEETLVDTAQLSSGQAFVSMVGRLAVVAAGGLALVGIVRAWRAGRPGHRPWPAMWLLVAPAFLIASNDFGGEILFRAVLFASPMLGMFGAWALLGRTGRGGPWRAAAVVVVSTVFLGGFLVAHFGKDSFYVFTPEEIEAAAFVLDAAPPNSLIVEGSRNYPSQFRNYDRLRYVPIEREAEVDRRRIDADPVERLSDWMTDPRDDAAYLLITKSQKVEWEAMGTRPAGMLDRVEHALLASPEFEVAFRNRDAVVFVSTEDRE